MKKQPFITLEMGKTYEHKLTIRDISTLEQGGVDINKYIVNENQNLLMSETLSILYVSLKDKPQGLTLDGFIDLVDDSEINFIDLLKKAREIVVNSYPDKKEETESPNSQTVMNAKQQMP